MIENIIPNPLCRECKGTGAVHCGDNNTGMSHPCTTCGTRTALAFLLVRIGSWTDARWDQHVRYEFGDDIANALARMLDDARVPIEIERRRESASHAPSEEIIHNRILARIDALVSSSEEAFEEADQLHEVYDKDRREHLLAKGHRIKATAHELGCLLAPRLAKASVKDEETPGE